MTENETTNGIGGETNGIHATFPLIGDPPDGDALEIMRGLRGCVNMPMFKDTLCRETTTSNVIAALETLADMVERDYVKRESIEGVMDTDRELVAENIRLTAERDEWKERYDSVLEGRNHWSGIVDNIYRRFYPREEYGMPNDPTDMINEAIDLLTDDDEPRGDYGATNLEWHFVHDEAFRTAVSAWAFSKLNESPEQPYKVADWLMTPHEDGAIAEHQSGVPGITLVAGNAAEIAARMLDAQSDTNGTCPDSDETCPNHSKAHSKTEPSLSQLFGILSDESCRQYADQPEHKETPDCENDSREKLVRIEEPDTIRNEFEDNGYMVMPYHNGEKQAKLRGKEYDQVIFDELHDSREKLEADMWAGSLHITTTERENAFVNVSWKSLLEWLDRMEDIVNREWIRSNKSLREGFDEFIDELEDRARYWKQEVQHCLDCAYPQSHSPERRYAPEVMDYPRHDGFTTPSTLVCAVIDGLRDEKGGQHMALFNDAHRLECENRNLSMDLAECMEAKGKLEDELRAVERQLKQERGLHSVTLNNWEQAKGKLRRERESLQAWKASLDEKILQLVVLPVLYPGIEQVDEISGGPRGDAGFGSTSEVRR